jgi:CrcB protein
MFGPQARLLLFTGILGGFTTFSAFGLETIHLLRRGHMATAAAYVALNVLVGLVAFQLAFAAVPHSRAR